MRGHTVPNEGDGIKLMVEILRQLTFIQIKFLQRIDPFKTLLRASINIKIKLPPASRVMILHPGCWSFRRYFLMLFSIPRDRRMGF